MVDQPVICWLLPFVSVPAPAPFAAGMHSNRSMNGPWLHVSASTSPVLRWRVHASRQGIARQERTARRVADAGDDLLALSSRALGGCTQPLGSGAHRMKLTAKQLPYERGDLL